MRAARRAAGYSQESFAAVCGLDRSYMGHVERGERNPTLLTILRIAGGLDVRVSALVDELPGD